MVEVDEVTVMRDRVVRLGFSDGSVREVDLAPLLWGPAFELIARDDDEFAKVAVDREVGTIVWPNGADLDPVVLHGDEQPARQSPTSVE